MAGRRTLPDIGVDFGYTRGGTTRVNTADFGDGYNQRSSDGINVTRLSYNISWTNIDTARKNILQEFLESTLGVESFMWQPPDMNTTLLWTNSFPSITPVAAGIWTVTVTLDQVFDV